MPQSPRRHRRSWGSGSGGTENRHKVFGQNWESSSGTPGRDHRRICPNSYARPAEGRVSHFREAVGMHLALIAGMMVFGTIGKKSQELTAFNTGRFSARIFTDGHRDLQYIGSCQSAWWPSRHYIVFCQRVRWLWRWRGYSVPLYLPRQRTWHWRQPFLRRFWP
jgi:hypothetical protein